jgi:DNA-binding NarL/FixJ family response regulator
VIRVLVADDSAVFRDAAAAVVDASPGHELVAAAASGEAAVELAAATRPDLVLLDVRMPGIGGVEAARRIAADHPEAVVALFTADGEPAPGAFPTLDKRTLSPARLAALS